MLQLLCWSYFLAKSMSIHPEHPFPSHREKMRKLLVGAAFFAVDDVMSVNWSEWSLLHDLVVLLFGDTLFASYPRRHLGWLAWTLSMGSASDSHPYTDSTPLKTPGDNFSSINNFQFFLPRKGREVTRLPWECPQTDSHSYLCSPYAKTPGNQLPSKILFHVFWTCH